MISTRHTAAMLGLLVASTLAAAQTPLTTRAAWEDRARTRFALADADKDGAISRTEGSVWVTELHGTADKRAQMYAELFDAYDANHDGAISENEAVAFAGATFAKRDTNHDGLLDEHDSLPVTPPK